MATVSFDHRIPCPLDAEALYARLTGALPDTDRAPFWPHELNRVQIPRLTVDTPFRATYRAPAWPDTHRRYRVSAVRPGAGFSYAAGEGHPFSGEIHVDCTPTTDGGSVLHGRGTYRMAAWRPERVFFRRWFEPRFFAALARGLADLDGARGEPRR